MRRPSYVPKKFRASGMTDMSGGPAGSTLAHFPGLEENEGDERETFLEGDKPNRNSNRSATAETEGSLYSEADLAIEQKKIDKLFEIPLTISICMLAMAHGSNEINVSAPLAA